MQNIYNETLPLTTKDRLVSPEVFDSHSIPPLHLQFTLSLYMNIIIIQERETNSLSLTLLSSARILLQN